MVLKKKVKTKGLNRVSRQKLLKKIKKKCKNIEKSKRKAARKTERIPISVIRTEEENQLCKKIKEDAQMRKELYEEALRNMMDKPQHIENLESLLSRIDVAIEVIDARDPLSSRDTDMEELVMDSGKKLFLVLNYTEFVPRENIDQWKKIFADGGFNCIELDENAVNLIGKGKKIGIFGQPKIGKNFISKKLLQYSDINVDLLRVSAPMNNESIGSFLTGRLSLKDVNFKILIGKVLNFISNEPLCIFYKLPEFSGANELLNSISHIYKLHNDAYGIKAAEVFIEPFMNNKILFCREADVAKEHFFFQFPV